VWPFSRGLRVLTVGSVHLDTIALSSEADQANDGDTEIGSIILTHRADGEVKGLNEFPGKHPPVVPVFNGPTWYQYSTKRFTGWVTKDEPVMNPENHDNNRLRLMHLLRLKPVQ